MKKSLLILALVALLLPATAQAQKMPAAKEIALSDSIRFVLQNDTVEAEKRFTESAAIILKHASPEEIETLSEEILYPFVKKEWKNSQEQLKHLMRLELMNATVYRERGGSNGYDKERMCIETALKFAEELGDNALSAYCCTVFAYTQIKRGKETAAHKYLYEAIKYYDRDKNYVKSSETLYVIASSFFNMKDADGMKRVLAQMREYLAKDKSKQSLYQFNVIQKTYFEMLLEKEKSAVDLPGRDTLIDSVMIYSQKNISLVENYLEELDKNWMHGWAYYYVAKAYREYFPEQTDTVFLYLDKALAMIDREHQSRNNEANAVMELKIYILQARSQTLSFQGNTEAAFNAMNESLRLLAELKNYNNLSEQRLVCYRFMADYYEKKGQASDALKFYKLLRESEEERYEKEKIQAINDMSAKYETEKKEMQIAALEKQQKTNRMIIGLVAGLALLLIAALFLLIRLFKNRKEKLEQEIYEKALLAELKKEELERNLQEKQILQQQYAKLETNAVHNERKLSEIAQQLAAKPTKTIIEKLSEWVSKSIMEKDRKREYLQKFASLDVDMLEQGYLTASENISGMDMKYIVCFAADMDTSDISLLFNVEPASVRTVKYRIKKKFGQKNTFKFLL